ncbi:MAG: hypothetical protein ABI823_21270, partial [Bryobacteraceae bacterium]
AQNNKDKAPDLCAPPPSGTAPALPAKLLEGQGTEWIKFPITTSNPEAQKFFLQGVAQMHSFWAVEAERSFRQAAALDPEAPMPWWGVAMASAGDFRPRFQLEDMSRPPSAVSARVVQAAKKAEELAAVPGKATDLEKLYIASILARRTAEPPKRDAAYIDGLRAIAAKYPHEVEAQSYLTLHLMRGFDTPSKAAREGSMEAAALLRKLAAEFPDHPGVHHYIIHGFEGSTFAKDAWPSCKRYAELVTNIPHALHMPGHIYAQTGRWTDAIKSFDDAAINERKWIASDRLYGTGHHGHNVHFEATAQSFSGDFAGAKASAAHLLTYTENPREAAQVDQFYTAYRQGWFSMLRALVQHEKWDEILDGKTLPEYNRPREMAWRHWAQALAFLAEKSMDRAEAESKAMDAALEKYKNDVKRDAPPELLTAREELDGQMQIASGKWKQGWNTLKKASDKERALRYSEPPRYPRPVAEAAGHLALGNGKFSDAEKAFQIALTQYEDDKIALTGIAEAKKRGTQTGAGAGR